MRIVYMGTPDFAVPALRALAKAGHDICYAVTRPDAAANRGKKIRFSPVKEAALELGIPVLQPETIKRNEAFAERLEQAAPDVIVVAAYGMILPKRILEIPARGCLNIHGSLLPRFRGAAPMQAAILAGDAQTGVTIMQMAEGLDTGDMLLKEQTPLDSKNFEMVHDELAEMGARLILQALEHPEHMDPQPQDNALATYAPMISKQDGRCDFTKSPQQLVRQMRAFDPWPGTYTNYQGKQMKLWQGQALEEETDQAPGTVLATSPAGIDISCGGRILRVTQLQMPGRKRTMAGEYLKGNSIETGSVLG